MGSRECLQTPNQWLPVIAQSKRTSGVSLHPRPPGPQGLDAGQEEGKRTQMEVEQCGRERARGRLRCPFSMSGYDHRAQAAAKAL